MLNLKIPNVAWRDAFLADSGAYGFRHHTTRNIFKTVGSTALSPVHAAIKGVVLDDDAATVVYDLLSTDFRRKATAVTTGTTDGTTADHLIDSDVDFATNSLAQVGDYVYNSTDSTFAKVTVVADGDLTLDADIFVSGEGYELGANLTGADGQVMIAYPQCYTGVFKFGGWDYYVVSEVAIPGLEIDPAFYVKPGGTVTPIAWRYAGKYQAVWCDNGVYKDHDGATDAHATEDHIGSVEGFTPITDQTRAAFRTLADNLGTGNKYWQEDYHLCRLRQILHFTSPGIRDAASPFYSYVNVPGHTQQSPFAYANTEASGLTTSLGMTDGSIHDGTRNVANNINGVENFFGSVWKFIDGININNWLVYLCSNPTNFADDTVTNYDQVLDQFGEVVLLPQTNNYQKYWHAGTLLPSTVHSVSSTFITDYFWQASGWRVARVGGHSSDKAFAGLAYLLVSSISSTVSANVGGRLAA